MLVDTLLGNPECVTAIGKPHDKQLYAYVVLVFLDFSTLPKKRLYEKSADNFGVRLHMV